MALQGPFAALPPLDFAVKDVAIIQASVVNGFQSAWQVATGQSITLAPGDPRTLFLLYIADLISAQRSAIDAAAKMDLLAYATGASLDHIGSYYGEDGLRLKQSAATVTLQFTLSSVAALDVLVQAGSQAAVGSLIFATDVDAVIPTGSLSVSTGATCLTPGTIGNDFFPGQISSLLTSFDPYILTVTNLDSSSGGSDPEDSQHYAERLYTVPAALSRSGPRLSYEADAYRANPTISDVSVVSVDEGWPLGTVNIFAVGPAGAPLSSTVLNQIYAKCSAEDRRPVADMVTVANPTAVSVTVSVQFWIDKEDAASESVIIGNVQAAGNQWCLDLTSKIGRSVNGSVLDSRLLAQKASRVKILSPADQMLNPSQIAVISGTPLFAYQGLEGDNWNEWKD